MAIDIQSNDWETATQENNSGDDSRTGVGVQSLVETLNEMERGKAYSAPELYEAITGEEPEDSDDLRAFVPAYNAMRTKDGGIKKKYREMLDGENETVARKQVSENGEKGFEKWHFAVVEAE